MRGDIVTEGSVCSIHGCQQVTITHKGGGDLSASVSLVNDKELRVTTTNKNTALSVVSTPIHPSMETSFTPKDRNGVKTTLGLMCKTSQAEWEYLLVEEGTILLIDGQNVLVKRKK